MRAFISTAALGLALFGLTGAGLPETGPVPDRKPGATVETPAAKPGDATAPKTETPAPVPEQKPSVVPEDKAAPVPQPKPGEVAPAEPQGKGEAGQGTGAKEGGETPKPEEKPGEGEKQKPQGESLEEQHLTIAPESEADQKVCEQDLAALGVRFETISRLDDGNGCGIDRPIKVSEILPGIKMDPDAVFRCPVARALARWIKESVNPAAAAALPEHGRITAVNQASSYICRLRNSAETGKISEHARGNAIDIASFSFEKKDAVEVRPRKEDSTLEGAFQRAVSATACLYFSTVLDPESDAAHENHFHLDLLERKAGFRYCH